MFTSLGVKKHHLCYSVIFVISSASYNSPHSKVPWSNKFGRPCVLLLSTVSVVGFISCNKHISWYRSPPRVSRRYCSASSQKGPRRGFTPSPEQQRHLLPRRWYFPHFSWICLNPTRRPNVLLIPSNEICSELTKSRLCSLRETPAHLG